MSTMVVMEVPEFLAPKQLAKELGAHPDTVRRWLRDGVLPSVWIGRRRRMPRAALARLIAEQTGA